MTPTLTDLITKVRQAAHDERQKIGGTELQAAALELTEAVEKALATPAAPAAPTMFDGRKMMDSILGAIYPEAKA